MYRATKAKTEKKNTETKKIIKTLYINICSSTTFLFK